MNHYRKYSITWSKDPNPNESYGAIYRLLGPPYSLKSTHFPAPKGRIDLVRAVKQILRTEYSAGYELEIVPDLVGDEHMGVVDLVFRR